MTAVSAETPKKSPQLKEAKKSEEATKSKENAEPPKTEAVMESEAPTCPKAEVKAFKCPKGHEMTPQAKGMLSWVTQVVCDKCGGSAYEHGDSWHCSTCKYDLCGICIHKPTCAKGHALSRNQAGFGSWFSGAQCDDCKKSAWNTGCAWSCRKCDYDLCNGCLKKKLLPREQSIATSDVKAVDDKADKKAEARKQAVGDKADKKAEAKKEARPSKPPPKADKPAQTPTPLATKDKVEEQPLVEKQPPPPPPPPEVPLSEAALMQKAKEDAEARKKAIEDRIAKDAADLKEEEDRLAEIKKKINEADKIKIRSETLRSSIEQAKRDIQRLDQEVIQSKEARKKAEEYARNAAQAQSMCEARLAAKREECQQLEKEMVNFLLHEAQKPEDIDNALQDVQQVAHTDNDNPLPKVQQVAHQKIDSSLPVVQHETQHVDTSGIQCVVPPYVRL